MKKEYDFARGKRGRAVPTQGKTRITMYLDDAVIAEFKAASERSGKGYQTLINEALRSSLDAGSGPVTPAQLRKILREELAQWEPG